MLSINNIIFLRSFVLLLVIFSHSPFSFYYSDHIQITEFSMNHLFSNMACMMDAFFIFSGILIALQTKGNFIENVSFREFMWNKIKRFYPTLFAVTLLMGLIVNCLLYASTLGLTLPSYIFVISPLDMLTTLSLTTSIAVADDYSIHYHYLWTISAEVIAIAVFYVGLKTFDKNRGLIAPIVLYLSWVICSSLVEYFSGAPCDTILCFEGYHNDYTVNLGAFRAIGMFYAGVAISRLPIKKIAKYVTLNRQIFVGSLLAASIILNSKYIFFYAISMPLTTLFVALLIIKPNRLINNLMKKRVTKETYNATYEIYVLHMFVFLLLEVALINAGIPIAKMGYSVIVAHVIALTLTIFFGIKINKIKNRQKNEKLF